MDTCTSWLHLLASLITDTHNRVCTSITKSSIHRFSDLSSSEQATISHLQLAITSLNMFLSDLQDNPADWITCMGCVKAFQLSSTKDKWSVNLSACSGNVEETCKVIIAQAIATAHMHIQSWVDGKCIAAQDATINSLTSDHTPEIATLISDPHIVDWSHCLLKSLINRLNAEHQAKINSAKENACADAKCLYDAELLRHQTAALSEATADFHNWSSSTLLPKYQAKEAESRAQANREFACFKMDLEAKFATKCQAVLVAANDDLATFKLVHAQVHKPHSSGEDPAFDKHARHAKHRADPISCPSRSVLCVRSPPPSPSQKLDKTPTKADFQVSQNTAAPVI